MFSAHKTNSWKEHSREFTESISIYWAFPMYGPDATSRTGSRTDTSPALTEQAGWEVPWMETSRAQLKGMSDSSHPKGTALSSNTQGNWVIETWNQCISRQTQSFISSFLFSYYLYVYFKSRLKWLIVFVYSLNSLQKGLIILAIKENDWPNIKYQPLSSPSKRRYYFTNMNDKPHSKFPLQERRGVEQT